MKKSILWAKILCLNILMLSVAGSILLMFSGKIGLGMLAFIVQLFLIWQIMGSPLFWKRGRSSTRSATRTVRSTTLRERYG